MLMNIINYVVRIAIIIIGILLLSGLITPPNTDVTMVRVMGAVLILWGVFRLLTYRAKLKQIERDGE